jgi:hypothetical protein
MRKLLRALFARRRAIAAGALAAAVAGPGFTLAARLRARLPDPLNGNRHIAVVTDTPAPPPGTPLLRLEPSLAVIGVVEGPAPGVARPLPSDTALRVSVFPEAEGLLRDDSRIELRVTAPDLLEVVERHFTPERRARLAGRVRAWRAAHEAAIDASLGRVKELCAEHLGADELGRRLYADGGLRGAIAGAFEREVIDPIDWNAVVDRATRSPAATSTGDFLRHAGPISASWAGLRAGYRARWSRVFDDVREGGGAAAAGGKRTLEAIRDGDPDEALLEGAGTAGDVLDRVDVGRIVLDPPAWALEKALSLFVPDARAFSDATLRRAGENLIRAFPKHKDRLARDYAALGKDLASEYHLGDRSLSALRALATDGELLDDIARRYGPEARARVERLLAALASDKELAARGRCVLTSALELLAGTLRELSLDDAGTGPNPLLVAFIRARLLGREEPLLILRSAGSGDPVSDGQIYVARRAE